MKTAATTNVHGTSLTRTPVGTEEGHVHILRCPNYPFAAANEKVFHFTVHVSVYPFWSQNVVKLLQFTTKLAHLWNFDPIGGWHVGFISQKCPCILRSGGSAVGCGGQSFDAAFIYPFKT